MMTPKLGLSALMLIGGLGFPSLYLSTESCGCSSTDIDADGTCDVEDCAPEDPQSYPDAPEVCDGVDNNCDGSVDENVGTPWYRDADGDGYGDPSSTVIACSAPEGYVENGEDCGDGDARINPGFLEECDSLDNDCDGEVDEGIAAQTWYIDNDGDGFGTDSFTVVDCMEPETGFAGIATDCDDTDSARYPGAQELCDGEDNDCDDVIDNVRFYLDLDGDGFGNPGKPLARCSNAATIIENGEVFVRDGRDCRDDPEAGGTAFHPGAAENLNQQQDNGCDNAVELLIEDPLQGYGFTPNGPAPIDIPALGGKLDLTIYPFELPPEVSEIHGSVVLQIRRSRWLDDSAVFRDFQNGEGITVIGSPIEYQFYIVENISNDQSPKRTPFEVGRGDHDFFADVRYSFEAAQGMTTSACYKLSVVELSRESDGYINSGSMLPHYDCKIDEKVGVGYFTVEHSHFSVYTPVYGNKILRYRPIYDANECVLDGNGNCATAPSIKVYGTPGGALTARARKWEFSYMESFQGTKGISPYLSFRSDLFYSPQLHGRPWESDENSISQLDVTYALRTLEPIMNGDDEETGPYLLTLDFANRSGQDIDLEFLLPYTANSNYSLEYVEGGATNSPKYAGMYAVDLCSDDIKKYVESLEMGWPVACEDYPAGEDFSSTPYRCMDFKDIDQSVNDLDDDWSGDSSNYRQPDPYDCLRFKVCGKQVWPDADGDGYGDEKANYSTICEGDLHPGDGKKYVTNNGDCNDDPISGPPIHPGAEELPADEVDQDCNGEELCLLDRDGDGYAGSETITSPFSTTEAPTCGTSPEINKSKASMGEDCYDANGSARPGQTNYFSTGRGDGSFDYNCNNSLEQSIWWIVAAMEMDGDVACLAEVKDRDVWGWVGIIPDCGTQGILVRCDHGKVTEQEWAPQECR